MYVANPLVHDAQVQSHIKGVSHSVCLENTGARTKVSFPFPKSIQ